MKTKRKKSAYIFIEVPMKLLIENPKSYQLAFDKAKRRTNRLFDQAILATKPLRLSEVPESGARVRVYNGR